MSVLVSVLLLLQLLLISKIDINNAECALGDPARYTRVIGNDGRLKYRDYREDPEIENYQTSERDVICVNDVRGNVLPACSCTYVNDFGGIYSCAGENLKSMPNVTRHVSNNEIRLYNLTGAKNVNHIEAYQFTGMKIKEIRIKLIETLEIEEQAFQGIFNLEILKITYNTLGKIGNPKFIFAGLKNLTVLDLSHNEITSWDTTENSTYEAEVNTPVPKLKVLDLSSNPIRNLNNDSFTWLQGSQLRHLILHNCGKDLVPVLVERGTLEPVSETLRTIDLSGSKIGRSSIRNLISVLTSTLQSLSLAKIGFTLVPYDVLHDVKNTLRHLSLSGNFFRILGQEEGVQPRSTSSQTEKIEIFPYMPYLEELDLTGCLIYFIENGTFDNFPKLKSLLLSSNQLITLSNLVSVKFPSLTYLDISYNPITLENINLTEFPVLETLDLSSIARVFFNKNTLTRTSGNSSLKKLSLCYASLKEIDNNTFSNFNSLELLDLSGNNGLGRNLHPDSFEGLTSLEELHLAECNVRLSHPPPGKPQNESIEIAPLHSLNNLKRLNLQRNSLRTLPTRTIHHLQKLDSLDLSDNIIGSWNEPVFSENSQVRHLNIGHNFINFITDAMLTDFQTLSTLIIAANPFVCNCNCYEFSKMVNNITENSKVYGDEQYEIQPRLDDEFTTSASTVRSRIVEIDGGFIEVDNKKPESHSFIREWDSGEEYLCTNQSTQLNSIPFDNIICNISTSKETEPDPDPLASEETNDSSDNTQTIIISVVAVSLVVILFGGITYWKWWYIRYFAILVKNATVLSFMSNGEEEPLCDRIFVYDVFISYSDRNREWVLNNLLTNLESTSNIKVCLHERDFQVGIGILENIIACMDQSRSILLVISNQFLKSQWCQFELHLAQHRLLETRREELILLFLEDIPKVKRSKTLHYLMRTKTYIQWPKNAEKNAEAVKLFWKRLRNAIIRNSNETSKRGVSTV